MFGAESWQSFWQTRNEYYHAKLAGMSSKDRLGTNNSNTNCGEYHHAKLAGISSKDRLGNNTSNTNFGDRCSVRVVVASKTYARKLTRQQYLVLNPGSHSGRQGRTY